MRRPPAGTLRRYPVDDTRIWGLVVCGSILVGTLVALLVASGVQRGVRFLRTRGKVRQIAREAEHYEQAGRASGVCR